MQQQGPMVQLVVFKHKRWLFTFWDIKVKAVHSSCEYNTLKGRKARTAGCGIVKVVFLF